MIIGDGMSSDHRKRGSFGHTLSPIQANRMPQRRPIRLE
jgi:hypothetical protein